MLMEFEKNEVLGCFLVAVGAITPIKPVGTIGAVTPIEPIGTDGLGAVRAITPIKPVGTVSDIRDDSGSTYSTNSTYS